MIRPAFPAMSKQDPRAQAAASRLLAAACRGQSRLWALQERRHESAATSADAAAAAEPLLEFCVACPIVAECEQWAEAEGFDGIAAGGVWAAGERRPLDWVRSRPLRGATKVTRRRLSPVVGARGEKAMEVARLRQPLAPSARDDGEL